MHDIVEPIGGVGCDAIGFTSDGKYLVRVTRKIGFPGDSLIVHDVSSWQVAWGITTPHFDPSSIAISPDNKSVAIAGSAISGGAGSPVTMQTQIAIVDMVQRKIVQTIPIDDTADVGRLAWSPNNANYAYGYAGGAIFDIRTGKRVVDEATEERRKPIIRYTPDGKYFIESNFGEHGARVRIWDGQHRELLQEIKAIPGCIAVSRDGRYLAMGGNKKIIVWQLK